LLTEKDILSAAKNIRKKLKPNGVFLLGIRDYDALLPSRPAGFPPILMKDKHGERVYVQSWEWDKAKPIYQFKLFLLTKEGAKWRTQCVTAKYRAWKRSELSTLFLKAGFSKVSWLMPKASGVKQPLGVMS
jgi:hypothetical protein